MRRRIQVPATYAVFTSTRPLSALKADLTRSMRVLNYGLGTIEDPSAVWFEVARQKDLPNTGSFMEALTTDDVLRVIQPITEGDGKDLARQIPLIPRRVNGLWTEGVVCGRPPLSARSEELLKKGIEDAKAGRVSQMPLFDEL